MIRGVAKIDGLAVGEFAVKFLGPQLEFTAKAAFVNHKTGETHGWTNATSSSWSAATIEKLRELRALMEIDLGRIHLEGGGEVLVAPQSAHVAASGNGASSDVSGIGEHLGVKQV